ncbi:hypothetical protein FRC14_001689 [Serendipita sp. 396]|nr:hypothetical protein FRC14_001689 [Serendipita sp. 396]KAG8785569.1 hypothetical protein FRC15_001127 [Serendipita sp. 397]KAG8800980.1 hypothetical protein FRC16_001571 [Serendipita sp. 398]KAG8815457.1 hypothetical protein FRC19_001018 [Serendipita sp. 401]KAG8821258.1 hypothetical protein FRC18_011393 [Serendipita sp. 400]KAG8849599.1 hypothetical protein FRB91_009745 [Serendipita sp. 411]KAG8870898.1 hypothetical protein FRC20_011187 [Serendipita sp. 405]KAG9051787.1 hypothetical prot
MANLQLSNNMSGLSDHFIVCKLLGGGPGDTSLLLTRSLSLNNVLDQIHQHWKLNREGPSACGCLQNTTIFASPPDFQNCSVELFLDGGGITARVFHTAWDLLKSSKSVKVVYWQHGLANTIGTATTATPAT